MRILLKALLPVAALLLCGVQGPAVDRAALRDNVAHMLDAVRANDEARFQAIIAQLIPGQLPNHPEVGPELHDSWSETAYTGPLTLASLRRFASECAYVGPDSRVLPEPPDYAAVYSCNGEPGHSLNVVFDVEGRFIWINLMSPEAHAAVEAQERQRQEENAENEARRMVAERLLAARVDELLAAARDGDDGRFAAILGRRPTFTDDRAGSGRNVAATVAALAPVARDCQRAADPAILTTHNMMNLREQDAAFVCGGASYVLITTFDEADRIVALRIGGPRS